MSFLNGVLAVNANRKNVTQFLMSNLGVIETSIYISLTYQQTALKDLSSNNDIVKKEADKGGAITIINNDDYITD